MQRKEHARDRAGRLDAELRRRALENRPQQQCRELRVGGKRWGVMVDDQPAAGLHLPVQVGDRSLRILRVLNHAEADDDVVLSRLERQLVDVALNDPVLLGLRTIELVRLDRRAQIRGRHERRRQLRQDFRETPRSAARLENLQSLRRLLQLRPQLLAKAASQAIRGDRGPGVRVQLRDAVLMPLRAESIGVVARRAQQPRDPLLHSIAVTGSSADQPAVARPQLRQVDRADRGRKRIRFREHHCAAAAL